MAAPTAAVAVDGGQSGCRVALVRDGRVVACGAGPATPSPSRPGGVGRLVDAVATALADADIDAHGLGLAAGLTGLGEEPDVAGDVAAALRARLGVSGVRLAGDLVTAYVGALGAAPGVAVAAGTGAVALAVDAGGVSARADGWGFLLGDDGSGYAIGRGGLHAALAAADGRGPPTALLTRAEARYGPLTQLPAQLHRAADPAGVAARFARDVADAATAGDAVAAGLLADAAAALSRTALAAARHVFGDAGAPTVSWTGGVFDIAAVRTAFCRNVAAAQPAAHVRPPRGTPLDGAVALAAGEPLATSLTHYDDG